MKNRLCPNHYLTEYLSIFNIYISRTKLESFTFYRKVLGLKIQAGSFQNMT